VLFLFKPPHGGRSRLGEILVTPGIGPLNRAPAHLSGFFRRECPNFLWAVLHTSILPAGRLKSRHRWWPGGRAISRPYSGPIYASARPEMILYSSGEKRLWKAGRLKVASRSTSVIPCNRNSA